MAALICLQNVSFFSAFFEFWRPNIDLKSGLHQILLYNMRCFLQLYSNQILLARYITLFQYTQL